MTVTKELENGGKCSLRRCANAINAYSWLHNGSDLNLKMKKFPSCGKNVGIYVI